MWRNYFQVFLRDLRRQKLSAGINIVGLALGLCAFLMVGIYVRDEYTWDSHWKNSGRIVRLVSELQAVDAVMTRDDVSLMAAPRLRDFFSSEIETAARIATRSSRMFVGGEEFNERVFMADRDLLDILDFELVAGNLEDVFAAPDRIALSEESAARLFGGEPALGKTLSLAASGMGGPLFQVVAIYRIPAGNVTRSLRFDNFSLLDENVFPEAQRLDWLSGSARSYFLLRKGVSPQDLAARLNEFVQTQVQLRFAMAPGSTLADLFRYRFQSLGDIHFNPITTDGPGGFQATVNGFGVIGVLVLAISLANFVILNLARSVERQREVGIRKVAGALSRALLVQFVCESLLLTAIALGLALVLLKVLLPVFATLLGTTLGLGLFQGSTWAALVALVLAVGAIGGLYPALVLSRQRPDHVLRPGGQSGSLGVPGLRKLLVGFQFVIATALIVATIVVYLQLAYIRQRDAGFSVQNVVTLQVWSNTASQIAALRNTISALPGVKQLALASRPVNTGQENTRELSRGDGAASITVNTYQTDYDFFSIYDMRLRAGRLFDAERDGAGQMTLATLENPSEAAYRLGGSAFSRSSGRLVINEAASRALGFANPAEAVGAVIEETINEGRTRKQVPVEIIGVIADNQFNSLRMPPRSEAYALQTLASWNFALKVDPKAMPTIADDLRRVWREVIGVGQAGVDFEENNVQRLFDRELKEGRLLLGFSALAVIVACLGLYGLVAFEVRRRTKEIGIRNVLGGAFGNIVALFLRQFGRPLLWANLLAWPLALWAVLRWLERFPYQIERWWLVPVCVVAGLLVSLVVALTVSATVFSAAGTRPVQALRYE
jgi:putative ABC transport system permease protein